MINVFVVSTPMMAVRLPKRELAGRIMVMNARRFIDDGFLCGLCIGTFWFK
jgi:hypothetical protein